MVSRSSIRSTPHPREFLEKLKTACTGGQDGKDHDACDSQARKAPAVTLPEENKCPEATDSTEAR